MAGIFAKVVLLALAVSATSADAQPARHRRVLPRKAEPAPVAVPIDARDSLVVAPGAFNGRPYWLALAQCGSIYFKLNTLYTDAAVRARVIKPDFKANAEFTKKLDEAIRTATAYFNGAERFLMTDRGIERMDAVLTYDGPSRAAGERIKTIEAAFTAAKSCPALYQACRQSHPQQCSESLSPVGQG